MISLSCSLKATQGNLPSLKLIILQKAIDNGRIAFIHNCLFLFWIVMIVSFSMSSSLRPVSMSRATFKAFSIEVGKSPAFSDSSFSICNMALSTSTMLSNPACQILLPKKAAAILLTCSRALRHPLFLNTAGSPSIPWTASVVPAEVPMGHAPAKTSPVDRRTLARTVGVPELTAISCPSTNPKTISLPAASHLSL